MSEPTKQPALDVRGAVDLAALNRPTSPPPGTPGGAPAAAGYVVDVTEENFATVVQGSAQYPVVVLLWMPTDQANATFGAELGSLADEYAGKFLLARVDAGASPQIAAAFQVQGVPTVVALLQGQPVPLFQGAPARDQVKGVIDQLLQAATANGVTGRAPSQGQPSPEEPVEQPAEPPLPPLHQEAFDAIERGDYDAAAAAYEKAIKQDRRDQLAVAGLAQVALLQRTQAMDLAAVRSAAAAAPGDIDAQLAVADAELLGGKADDAFARLLDVLGGADADGKERVRLRLLEFFEIVGPTDPRVLKARQRLAIALY